MDMTEKIARFLNFRYPIELRELAPEEGGGWMATIPQLSSMTFVGDGETAGEALESLEAIRTYLIPQLIQEGVDLPEPYIEQPNEPSIHAVIRRYLECESEWEYAQRTQVERDKKVRDAARGIGNYEQAIELQDQHFPIFQTAREQYASARGMLERRGKERR